MENDNDPVALLNNLDERRREAKELLDELKKMYSTLKTRVKRFEKKLAALNEEKDQSLIREVTSNVQLALNKFEIIDKKIAQCIQRLKMFDNAFTILQQRQTNDFWHLKENSRWVSSQLWEFKDSFDKAENEIRIAKKHLQKINKHIKFLRAYNSVPKGWSDAN